mmetsp:Transcript_6690/g.20328  ORF Transcript_6690/g.20328 Transcript_6690/m.20328 type:complete len:292 (-) Transcript_6690:978-1853(-)
MTEGGSRISSQIHLGTKEPVGDEDVLTGGEQGVLDGRKVVCSADEPSGGAVDARRCKRSERKQTALGLRDQQGEGPHAEHLQRGRLQLQLQLGQRQREREQTRVHVHHRGAVQQRVAATQLLVALLRAVLEQLAVGEPEVALAVASARGNPLQQVGLGQLASLAQPHHSIVDLQRGAELGGPAVEQIQQGVGAGGVALVVPEPIQQRLLGEKGSGERAVRTGGRLQRERRLGKRRNVARIVGLERTADLIAEEEVHQCARVQLLHGHVGIAAPMDRRYVRDRRTKRILKRR